MGCGAALHALTAAAKLCSCWSCAGATALVAVAGGTDAERRRLGLLAWALELACAGGELGPDLLGDLAARA